jgi:hypothetical protein
MRILFWWQGKRGEKAEIGAFLPKKIKMYKKRAFREQSVTCCGL